MSVKEFRPPIKGTVICHWCGRTNHLMLKMRFHRIDGIMGCDACWNIVKRVNVHLGNMTEETLMKDIVRVMKESVKNA